MRKLIILTKPKQLTKAESIKWLDTYFAERKQTVLSIKENEFTFECWIVEGIVMTNNETPTPRTDAIVSNHCSGEFIDFARTLERENVKLKAGLRAVESLINESRGVDGLHLNGDLAIWDSLRTGGEFESWLADFDEALTLARKELEGK